MEDSLAPKARGAGLGVQIAVLLEIVGLHGVAEREAAVEAVGVVVADYVLPELPVGRRVPDLENPLSLASLKQITHQVEDDYDADRYGVKLGLMFKGLEMNLAYYRAYSDIPVPLLDVPSFPTIFLTWGDIGNAITSDNPIAALIRGNRLDVIKKIDKVDIYGGSFDEPFTG